MAQRYRTFEKDSKTKTEINKAYYFKYIKNRIEKPEWQAQGDIEEDLFFELSSEELKKYFFKN